MADRIFGRFLYIRAANAVLFGRKRKIKLLERKFLQKCGYDHIHTELAMVNFY